MGPEEAEGADGVGPGSPDPRRVLRAAGPARETDRDREPGQRTRNRHPAGAGTGVQGRMTGEKPEAEGEGRGLRGPGICG